MVFLITNEHFKNGHQRSLYVVFLKYKFLFNVKLSLNFEKIIEEVAEVTHLNNCLFIHMKR